MSAGAYAYGSMAGLQVIGGIFDAEAQKSTAKLNKQIAEFNAKQLEKSALAFIEQGREESNKIREQGAQVAAAQKSKFAAGNIDLSSGAAVRAVENTFAMSSEDARNLETNYFMKAMGLKYDALSTRTQGAINYNSAVGRANQTIASQGMAGAQTMLNYQAAKGK